MVSLVVGGAKSGKSMFAQDLAKSFENKEGRLYYLATMNPYDLEDMKRIENHIKDREGYGFETVEEPLEIAKVAENLCKEDTILIDSITSIVTNSMFRGKEFYKEVNKEILKGINEIINKAGNVILVSDYLFSDSINYDEYTESFRKELGIVNRRLAEVSDNVLECNYGQITCLRGIINCPNWTVMYAPQAIVPGGRNEKIL